MHQLELVPYRTRKEGIEALERDLDSWHAVLLDAKMFDESENEVASLAGLSKAKDYLEGLAIKKVLPYFISTGQLDLLDNELFSQMVGKYYVKERNDVQLIEDIKSAISRSDSIHIKRRYSEVFNALDNMGILMYTESILLDILLPLHYPDKHIEFKPAHHYNQLRQLLEYIFRACNNFGILPDLCLQGGNVNLNQCSIYLAGKPAEKIGVRFGHEGMRLIPQDIENIIRFVLDFGNLHSHTVELTDEDKTKIDNLFRTSHSKYLIFGLTHNLCEVIIWFSRYIIDHPNKEVNSEMWNYFSTPCAIDNGNTDLGLAQAKDRYEGQPFVPEKDGNGVWHCGECQLAIKFWNDGKMRLKEVARNTGRYKDTYPFFAKYDKID